MDVAVTFGDVLANAKKAVVGGASAALAAVALPTINAFVGDGKIDAGEANGIISAGVIAFAGGLLLVYNAKNKPLTGNTKPEPEEPAADAGEVPDPSLDDEDLLDTSAIEPVVTGDDGLDQAKHAAV